MTHHRQLEHVRTVPVRREDTMAVDGAKLEERVHLVERNQIDARWREDIFERHLQPSQLVGGARWSFEDDADIEVRALCLDSLV